MDATGWPERRKRIWCELLEQFHAERDLRFADLTGYSTDQVRSLALAATGGDSERAHDIAMRFYTQRLLAGGTAE